MEAKLLRKRGILDSKDRSINKPTKIKKDLEERLIEFEGYWQHQLSTSRYECER